MIWKVPLKGKFCVVLWYLAYKILKHVSPPGAIKIVWLSLCPSDQIVVWRI